MRRTGAYRPEEVEQGTRAVGAYRRTPSAGRVEAGEVALRIPVVLRVVEAHSHVEQVPHRRAIVAGASQDRQQVRDAGLYIENAAEDEDPCQSSGKRLGGRHQDVGFLRTHPVAVRLGDDHSAMEHDEAVGAVGGQHLPNVPGTTTDSFEGDPGDVPKRFGKGRGRRRSPPHLLRGVELSHVMEPPCAVGRILKVGGIHGTGCGRRLAGHRTHLAQWTPSPGATGPERACAGATVNSSAIRAAEQGRHGAEVFRAPAVLYAAGRFP